MSEATQVHEMPLSRKELKRLLKLNKQGLETVVIVTETLSNDEYEATLHTTVDVGAR